MSDIFDTTHVSQFGAWPHVRSGLIGKTRIMISASFGRPRYNPAAGLLQFSSYSGVVQLVARQPLELVILVRVQAPEPPTRFLQDGLTTVNTLGAAASKLNTQWEVLIRGLLR